MNDELLLASLQFWNMSFGKSEATKQDPTSRSFRAGVIS
jgi:hypothetical protein